MGISVTPVSSSPHWAEVSLAAARRGDHDAFATLVTPHEQRLKRLARRFTRTAEDAEDICQESLLKAFTKLDQFAGSQIAHDEFCAWLTKITANCAIDFLRRKKANRWEPLEECESIGRAHDRAGANSWNEGPETRCSRQEQVQRAVEAIAQLSPELRSVCVLRNLMELSTKEVATRLGISAIAVRMRLFRAHAHLRKLLSPRTCPSRRRRGAGKTQSYGLRGNSRSAFSR
jgi:RNA polymerase sigma-70 factor, ECF subfamily